MTDEVTANAGSGGPKFAGYLDSDGNFWPLSRLAFGTGGPASIQVDDVDGQRLPVKIGGAISLPTGAATEATLASFLAANHTDLAALATLLVATNTDLGTILHGDLASILAKQSSDPATQATLAAVLAKLTSDPATQTSLAALLATAGATSGAAVITDANGTIQQYLRGLVKLWIAGLSAGEAHVGEVGGKTIIASASVTRPADTTAYAVGDLIANSTTAGSVTPLALTLGRINQGTGMIRRARLKANKAAWINAIVRVHFYKNSPTCANGDNGAWSTTDSEYLGAVDVTLDKSFSDPFSKGIGVPNSGSEINFDCASASTTIYALLEARTAITTASGDVVSLVVESFAN